MVLICSFCRLFRAQGIKVYFRGLELLPAPKLGFLPLGVQSVGVKDLVQYRTDSCGHLRYEALWILWRVLGRSK